MATSAPDEIGAPAQSTTLPLPTEMLEQVLMQVDAKTLLLAQRVNKQFRATIKDSPKLQEALWFRPPSGRDEVVVNPFIVTRPGEGLLESYVCFKGHIGETEYMFPLCATNDGWSSDPSMDNFRAPESHSWHGMVILHHPGKTVDYRVEFPHDYPNHSAFTAPGLRCTDFTTAKALIDHADAHAINGGIGGYTRGPYLWW